MEIGIYLDAFPDEMIVIVVSKGHIQAANVINVNFMSPRNLVGYTSQQREKAN